MPVDGESIYIVHIALNVARAHRIAVLRGASDRKSRAMPRYGLAIS